MRPYPDEILRSMQFSLDQYVIPHVNDKWGRYVAKVMKRMLIHLERRWQHEGELLVEDVADLRNVLGGIRGMLDGQAGEAEGLLGCIDDALQQTKDAPTAWVPLTELTGHSEVVREALVKVIEGLDRHAADGGDVPDEIRSRIRAYLRREVDRDNRLVEPTFMSFAPPGTASSSDAA